MKNKAFTLIELLAVIVVLGIIMVIAVTAVSNYINTSRLNAFLLDEKMMIKATQKYLAAGVVNYPSNIGDTIEVRLSDLQSNGFIERIKSPSNQSAECEGYIIVTKIEVGKYDYTSHLDCLNGIGSASEDSLVAHYTFDDFQEPTVNLLPGDGSFESSSGVHIGNPSNSNSNQTSFGSNWYGSTHYNDGVIRIKESGGIVGSKVAIWEHNSVTGWKGLTNSFCLETGKTYSASVWVRVNRTSSDSLYDYAFYGSESQNYAFNWEKSPSQNPGEWILGTKTFTISQAACGAAYLYGMSGETNGFTVEYDGYQLEEKSYTTPFVVGTRTGIVKDYSNNGIIANLTLINTPRWISDNRIRSGVYRFDGVDDYIQTNNNISLTGSQTFYAWIKPEATDDLRGIIAQHNHATPSNLGLSIHNGKLNASIGYTDGTREWNDTLSNGNIPANQWTNVAMVYNSVNNTIAFYINGVLDSQRNITKTVRFTNDKLLVGLWSNSYFSGYYFQGMIDDVRVYNRVLSTNEILQLYNATK